MIEGLDMQTLATIVGYLGLSALMVALSLVVLRVTTH